ncbi:oligopeptide transporter 5-like [Elaeis guineensis]|uniref:oligopeptide transporter 5-like n=1 Tax=Elaeis guineensis var. tenera TaxID=51953 RepID=UPI003C6DAA96
MAEKEEDVINNSPIEEVRLTVPPTDDNTLPVLTFRTWVLGIPGCIILSVLTQFLTYRQSPIYIPDPCITVMLYLIGKSMANGLPRKQLKVPGTPWSFSLNPGPFNMKEHCLLSMLATAGTYSPYGFELVAVVKAFYHKTVRPLPAFLVVIATQMNFLSFMDLDMFRSYTNLDDGYGRHVIYGSEASTKKEVEQEVALKFLGYGFAGVCTKFLVHNPYMWWPATLVDVSFYRYSLIHSNSCVREKSKGSANEAPVLFLMVAVSSFAYHVVPVYFFPSITALSFICWIWKDSVTAQQIGSGQAGLGLGSFSLDWMTTTSFLGSPLATPMFVICNMFIGFVIKLYVIAPISYWTNAYNAKRFPFFSQGMFDADGQKYNISRIIDEKLQFDEAAYNNYSKLYFSIVYVYSNGFFFACLTSSISHVALYHGRSLWNQVKKAYKGQEEDIHSRLMKQNYKAIPQWWFYLVLFSMVGLAILTCQVFNEQVQLSSWEFLIVLAMVSILLLPNAVLTATTNMGIPINIFFEMLNGYLSPGKPIANMTFKIYGTLGVSMATQAISSFKQGHYMKIPPKSMFLVQIIGTALSTTASFVTGWWIFSSVPHICDLERLPKGSPWTCPSERIAFSVGVAWGLVGPQKMFYPSGTYSMIFVFFIIGLLAPVPVWILSQMYPEKKWIQLITMPVIFYIGSIMPPVSAINIWPWMVVGTIFNYVVFKKYKGWWVRYNYILSSGLDIGAAFVAVVATIL